MAGEPLGAWEATGTGDCCFLSVRPLLLADLHGLVDAERFGHARVFRPGVGSDDAEFEIAHLGRVGVGSAALAEHGERSLLPQFIDRYKLSVRRAIRALRLGDAHQIIFYTDEVKGAGGVGGTAG